MKEHPAFEQRQEKNQEWARGIAERFGIALDASEENFIIPLRNKQGEERGKEIIPAWQTIPFKYKGTMQEVPAEKAIRALQNHPELNLAEALEKDLTDVK